MAQKPSKKQLLDSIAGDSRGTNTGRRRVLQSGAFATIASVIGLGSIGSASASSSSDDFEVVAKTANPKRLNDATLLLEELANKDLISSANISAFSFAPLGTNDSGSAILKYGDRVVHTFVLRSDGTKLTVNLPEDGDPYAIYAPDGSGTSTRVRFDQIKGTVETTKMEYTQEVSTNQIAGAECPSTCGGTTCSPAGNCWLDKRECVETCRSDGAGGYYCHDSCSCGC
ncbi:hypothetical protein [Halorussus pelagicus]|uniref:hypothetical protein n=1 Tax=Halorussus pelagicus TaxID=2505977 RepID=UPI000FFC9FC5|nr:hypothetical protein [Halorussus pelagicus]